MPKRIRKRARPARARGHYQPTPIAGLVLYPTVLLLNLIVRTAEDNAKTDGRIPAETVDVVTALIRNTYGFPDLDLARGKGVVISFIGQFFHPDDYEEHRIAEMHRRGLLDSLQGDLGPQPLKVPRLRTSKVQDPALLSQGREKTLAVWYKQRLGQSHLASFVAAFPTNGSKHGGAGQEFHLDASFRPQVGGGFLNAIALAALPLHLFRRREGSTGQAAG